MVLTKGRITQKKKIGFWSVCFISLDLTKKMFMMNWDSVFEILPSSDLTGSSSLELQWYVLVSVRFFKKDKKQENQFVDREDCYYV